MLRWSGGGTTAGWPGGEAGQDIPGLYLQRAG